MGTRADFYVKVDDTLEWLGSIAWDGYAIDDVADATSEQDFRDRLRQFFAGRNDVTLPHQGFPWPWRDSRLTDYAYVYVPDVGVVYRFGDEYPEHGSIDDEAYYADDGKCELYIAKAVEDNPDPSWAFDEGYGYMKKAEVRGLTYCYPDMRNIMSMARGDRSGIISVGGGGVS